ncbi:restriction endonuclease subunit S [Acinetobacter pseudolwoffii]|uniref:restriction endonuclease subunit S n=1 Tax=Acinetobacter pseudolwoffii TaxID=2053287 RepID=UPI002577BCCB|nr:restriction endonuclease subunit S [Acinetobacter pseudolwoffii]MDM1340580.1 restriction endonuclease subunit S [Acinetobacter pseudolwoffii]
MDFKSYPSYKDSGVEWLGEVPEHWQQKPIWSLFSRIKRVNHPNEPLLSVYRDYGVILKDSRDDNHNRASEDLTPYQLVRPNDLVINKMKAWQGSIAISEYQGIVSPAYYVYEPKQPYCSKYIHFLIRSTYFIQSYKNFSKGIRVNQWDLEHDAFTHIDLLLPPLSEQNKIVSFLDTETSRIDHLIAKQEKLINLLEEHRKSVISHAVTKGLDPNVPMKDSGVEWLGEVPEHWYVTSVKRGFSVKLGKMLQPEKNSENDVSKKYLKASNISWNVISSTENEMWFSENDILQLRLNKGDLLVTEGGDVGKSCIWDSTQEMYYQNSINRVRSKKHALNKFLYYWIFKLKSIGYIDILCNKATIAHFTAEKLNEMILLLPSKYEQNEIVNYLDEKTSKIDTLIAKQRELIAKLKKYRISIISHAVTGKIDVRDLVA